MTHAVDRVFGHLLTVIVLELALLVVLLGDRPWYDSNWGVLAGFGLGALGAPVTLLVPYLLVHDNPRGALVLLLAAPVVTLVLRMIGIHLRVDQPDSGREA